MRSLLADDTGRDNEKRRLLSKAEVLAWLKARFSFRFHMLFILFFTFLGGILVNKFLFLAGFSMIVLRYPLTLIVAYFLFLGTVRVWYSIVRHDSGPQTFWEVLDGTNLHSELAARGLDLALEDPETVSRGLEAGGQAVRAVADACPEGGGGVIEGAGKVIQAGASFDEGCLVLIPFFILMGLFMGLGGYLMIAAPEILSETLFHFLLAAGLASRLKETDREPADWVGTVMGQTGWSFGMLLLATCVFGFAATCFFPQFHTLAPLLNACLS